MLNSACFSKQKRLLSPSDFKSVYRKAKRISESNITIITKPNNKNTARIGFGFSKKKVKLAVSRNILKRVGRESFRLALMDMPAVDIVVVANLPITQLDKRELRGIFDRLWQRLTNYYDGS